MIGLLLGSGLKKRDCGNTGPLGATKGFISNFSSSKFHKKEIAEFSPFLSRHNSRALLHCSPNQADKETRGHQPKK
jgi:hypothetical protein